MTIHKDKTVKPVAIVPVVPVPVVPTPVPMDIENPEAVRQANAPDRG